MKLRKSTPILWALALVVTSLLPASATYAQEEQERAESIRGLLRIAPIDDPQYHTIFILHLDEDEGHYFVGKSAHELPPERPPGDFTSWVDVTGTHDIPGVITFSWGTVEPDRELTINFYHGSDGLVGSATTENPLEFELPQGDGVGEWCTYDRSIESSPGSYSSFCN